MGAIGEQGIILLRVVCGRTTIELCSGCKDAEGCVGKSEEDFRREHHSQEASAPTGVEQPTTTRLVGGGLYLEDQGYLRLPRLHRGEHRGERDGPDLSRRFGVEVRSVPNGCVYPGEYAVLFRLTVDAPGRGEPRGCVYKHAHRQQNVVHGGR